MTISYFFSLYFMALALSFGVINLIGGLLSLLWAFDKGRRLKVDFNRTYDNK